MIIIVLGFSKSGTTLVSKTLHESGINMHPEKTGNYNKSKYEDPEAIEILKKMVGCDKLQSLYLPDFLNCNDDIINDIKKLVNSRSGDWGIKQPWMTLCYDEWKKYLPKHIVVGITRKNICDYWKKRNKKINKSRVLMTQKVYNAKMERYDIPILSFEDFIKNGPGKLEKIIGRKLKDVRNK